MTNHTGKNPNKTGETWCNVSFDMINLISQKDYLMLQCMSHMRGGINFWETILDNVLAFAGVLSEIGEIGAAQS